VELHQLPWRPLDPAVLPDLLGGVDAPWWLAGGWAIDAFLGRVTRVHEDTDVLVLRRDQAAFRARGKSGLEWIWRTGCVGSTPVRTCGRDCGPQRAVVPSGWTR
jgi:hypothetical protein